MKLGLSAFAVVAAFTITSCDNPSSKIHSADSAAETEVANHSSADGNITAGDVLQEGTPAFAFAEMNHDFGNIDEGKVAEHVFTFENTGDAPLIISNARGSCGCTVPEWPRTPIAPGATGEIKVSFNSSGKPGNQKKSVTITANTVPPTTVLNISAQVAPKATDAGK